MGKAEELVAAVMFLCSDEARFITGHTLAVDGGFLAQ
jgi:NAD(P)-dependent dehydrogenase (short-subunit alcohol dehydrogenase family)